MVKLLVVGLIITAGVVFLALDFIHFQKRSR